MAVTGIDPYQFHCSDSASAAGPLAAVERVDDGQAGLLDLLEAVGGPLGRLRIEAAQRDRAGGLFEASAVLRTTVIGEAYFNPAATGR